MNQNQRLVFGCKNILYVLHCCILHFKFILQSLNETLLKMQKGCGVTKNCLSLPEFCMKNNSCNALLSIVRKAGKYEVELFSKEAIYVAMSLSHDFNMVEMVYYFQSEYFRLYFSNCIWPLGSRCSNWMRFRGTQCECVPLLERPET